MLTYHSCDKCENFDIPEKDIEGAVITKIEGDYDKDIGYLEITLKDGRKMSIYGSGQIEVDSLNMS